MTISVAKNSGHKRGEESLAKSRREEHLSGQKRGEMSTTKHIVHSEVVKTSTRSRRDHTTVFDAIAVNDLKRFEMLSSRQLNPFDAKGDFSLPTHTLPKATLVAQTKDW